MKTVKQISDDLGINKLRVYRYIQKHRIGEAYRDNGIMYYDDTAQKAISRHFAGNDFIGDTYRDTHQTVSRDTVFDTVIDTLKSELEAKNKLIDEQQQTIKNLTEIIQASQILHGGTMQKQITDKSEKKPRGIFGLFKKGTS
jgi:hypothetical protein